MDNKKQIKSTDWLTKNYSKEELAEMKAKADKEAEEELKQKQIEEIAKAIDKSHWRIEQDFTGCHINSTEMATNLYANGYRKERQGEWGFDGMSWTCSECGEYATKGIKTKFCSNCGSKMKGE